MARVTSSQMQDLSISNASSSEVPHDQSLPFPSLMTLVHHDEPNQTYASDLEKLTKRMSYVTKTSDKASKEVAES